MTPNSHPQHPIRPDDTPPPSGPSRRQLLTMLGAGGLVAAGGYHALGRPRLDVAPRSRGDAPESTAANPAPAAIAAAGGGGDRLLVVIELRGGNDGLATVVPGDGRLRDMRPGLLTDAPSPVPFVGDTQLHPALAGLRDQGLAVVQGVGTPRPDGSHFEMEQRWWQGDSGGDLSLRTGFLGRLCDELATDAGTITGVTVGNAASPFLTADRATTVGIADPWAGWFLGEDERWFADLRRGLGEMSRPEGAELTLHRRARGGLADALAFGEMLESLEAEAEAAEVGPGDDYASTDLSFQLRLTAGLLAAETGIRVVHLELGGFDTHDGQAATHDELMDDLGTSLAAFRADLATRGLAQRTMIVTTSEFGRRPEENQSGTDHGTAGPALVCGPVATGLFGDPPVLDRLDPDGNLVTTTLLDDYYATIAQGWLGIDAGLVLPAGGTVISELFA